RPPVDKAFGLLLGGGDIDEPRADELGCRRRQRRCRDGSSLPGLDGEKRWTAGVEAARSCLCLCGCRELLESELIPVDAPPADDRVIAWVPQRRVTGSGMDGESDLVALDRIRAGREAV